MYGVFFFLRKAIKYDVKILNIAKSSYYDNSIMIPARAAQARHG